jgi:hypothetical protein
MNGLMRRQANNRVDNFTWLSLSAAFSRAKKTPPEDRRCKLDREA